MTIRLKLLFECIVIYYLLKIVLGLLPIWDAQTILYEVSSWFNWFDLAVFVVLFGFFTYQKTSQLYCYDYETPFHLTVLALFVRFVLPYGWNRFNDLFFHYGLWAVLGLVLVLEVAMAMWYLSFSLYFDLRGRTILNYLRKKGESNGI